MAPGANVSVKESTREEEQLLINRILNGDRQAWGEFYQRYFDRLYRFVYYQVGGDHADTEDVMQEALLAAIRSLGSFRGQSRLYTWLCGIARHKAADLHRQRSKIAQQEEVSFAGQVLQKMLHTTLLVEQIVEKKETRELVHKVLFSLPADYHRVLALKYIEGFSMKEIAHLMGRSPKAIESLLSRARQAFRIALVGEEESQ